MKQGWLSWLLGEPQTAVEDPASREAKAARAEVSDLRSERDRLSAAVAEAEAKAGKADRAAADREAENGALRQELEAQREEVRRVSAELDQARQKDSQALDEMLGEVDRERTQLRQQQQEREAAQRQLSAELQLALENNRRLQAEATRQEADLTKVRGNTARLESELQHLNAERQRLLSEYGQLCMEAVGFREATEQSARLKEEVERLREELEQSQSRGGGAARSLKKGERAGEIARREEEIKRLGERVVSLERELAARGSLLPVTDLPGPLQAMVAHLGESADALRMVQELWERLMDQEARWNAAREEISRRSNENDFLRAQLGDLYSSLVTPITVVSASADLLLMQQGLPPAVQASLQEMKETMTAVRQLIVRMQKMTQKFSSPGA